MKIDSQGRIVDFSEKPKGEDLKAMQVDTTALGLTAAQAAEQPYIASMGIYVFKKEVLVKLLQESLDQTDFGKEIIPNAAEKYNLQAFLFNGYWEDIGTIESFYDANLALTQQPVPPFSFYAENAPIYTRSRYLPPTKMIDAHITESMISEGCILKNCRIHHSVLGVRSRVGANCTVEDTMMMGADYYEHFEDRVFQAERGEVSLGIGAGSTVRRAIIDKNARIGSNVMIVNKDNVQEAQREDKGFFIRNGIVVILKNAIIPNDTVI
jgi:glucose-1-phosphate adenylyltransferase